MKTIPLTNSDKSTQVDDDIYIIAIQHKTYR